ELRFHIRSAPVAPRGHAIRDPSELTLREDAPLDELVRILERPPLDDPARHARRDARELFDRAPRGGVEIEGTRRRRVAMAVNEPARGPDEGCRQADGPQRTTSQHERRSLYPARPVQRKSRPTQPNIRRPPAPMARPPPRSASPSPSPTAVHTARCRSQGRWGSVPARK